jgi:superfamily II DNA or RNA helicase
MSGITWRPRGRESAAARLPWLRPPRATSARHLIQAVLNTSTGSSTCPRAAPEARCLIVPVTSAAAETVLLRAPLRLTGVGGLAAMSRSTWASGPASGTAAAVRNGGGQPPTLDLRARLLGVLQPPLEASLSRSGPLEWPADLMNFQLTGIGLLLDRDRLLLADEMGLGKTIQAIAAIRLLAHRGQISTCLVVVPAAVITQWLRELERWAPELRTSVVRGPALDRIAQWRMPAHVHVVSYETLRSDAQLSRERIWDLVVIDEAQKIKNHDSDVAAAIKRLLRRRAWALTGTPLENRLDDLASVLEFVAPRLPDQQPHPLGPGDQLRRELGRVQLRRRKQDVLPELPPKTLTDLLVEMTPEQRRSYERAENEGLVYLKELGSSITIANVLELILRLKQLCNFEPESGASAKLADLQERLASLVDVGQRALVFSQFADEYYGASLLARRLKQFRPVLYTGAMMLSERDAAVRRFQEDPSRQVMVLSLRAGGQGLNLPAASYVFHFDRWWNPAVEDQATDRSHRLGQRLPVHVYSYTIENSIEERIRDILVEKRELFVRIIEGAGIDVHGFSRDELFRTVGLPLQAPVQPGHNPLDFEREVASRLEVAGYMVEFTAPSHDGGIDLVATRVDAGGLARSKLYVQCKVAARPVGVGAVLELIGSLPPLVGGVTGVLASRAGFSAEARSLARVRGIDLWGPEDLVRLGA